MKLDLHIDTDTLTGSQLPRDAIEGAVQNVGVRIRNGEDEGIIRDANGQKIGRWQIMNNDVDIVGRCLACEAKADADAREAYEFDAKASQESEDAERGYVEMAAEQEL